MAEKDFESEKPRSRFNYTLLAGFVALLTPLAYLVGDSYHQGFVNGYDVDSTIFNPSIPDIYLYSFYAVGSFLSKLTNLVVGLIALLGKNKLALALVILVFFAVVVFYFKFRDSEFFSKKRKKKRAEKIEKIVKRSSLYKAALLVLFGIYLVYATIIIVAAFASIWWLPPVSAFNLGFKDSSKTRIEFDQIGCCVESRTNYSKCKAVINKENIEYIRGIFVGKSGNYFSFYTNNGSSTFVLPDGASLRSVKLPKSCPVSSKQEKE